MSKKGQFEVITGLWRRTKSGNRGEEYWYGKPKLNAALSINPGDEVYVFRTSARNARNGDPQMYLKIKRANGKVDVVPVE
jgi:hypothetical protein